MDETIQKMIETICFDNKLDCRDCPLFIRNNIFESNICLRVNSASGLSLEMEKYVADSYKKMFPDGTLSLPAEITVTEFMEVFK